MSSLTNSMLCCLCIGCGTVVASAQMVTTATGYQTHAMRFEESFQVGWTYRDRHMWAQFSGGSVSPLGSTASNPGFTSGWQAGPWGLSLSAGQSVTHLSSSVTPVLTSVSGFPSSLSIGVARPFVLGTLPVGTDGTNFMVTSPLAERVARGEVSLERFAHRTRENPQPLMPPQPVPPLAQKTNKDVPRHTEVSLNQLLEKGLAAERNGQFTRALVYYRLAAARTEDPGHHEAVLRLERLSRESPSRKAPESKTASR